MENKKKLKLSEMLLKSNSAILLLILIVVVIVFSVLNGNYFSTQNATNIFYSATTVGLLAIGETFLIIGGHIDLSNSALAEMCIRDSRDTQEKPDHADLHRTQRGACKYGGYTYRGQHHPNGRKGNAGPAEKCILPLLRRRQIHGDHAV